MNIKIVGKNVTVSEGMKNKIIEKLSKLEKYEYIKPETTCNVLIRTVKDDQIIEVTIPVENKKVIRAEKRSTDLYAAIDMVEETLTRQIRKKKEKMIGKKRNPSKDYVDEEDYLTSPTIVKEKVIPMMHMTPEEAAEQMEMLDHDFFLFVNADTGNVSVIYKRKDSDYGMIYAVS